MARFKPMQKGEITVFLSLIFILLLSLLAALLESVSLRIARNERQADMQMALESVFAEYHQDMWKEYHILGLEATYQKEHFAYENVLERLQYYGAEHTENTVEEAELLTDCNGRAFYRLAVNYELGKYGISVDSDEGWSDVDKEGADFGKEQSDVQKEIDIKLDESETELPQKDNPLEIFDKVSKTGLLAMCDVDVTELSDVKIDAESLASGRRLRVGNSSFSAEGKSGIAGKALFANFLLRHFSSYTTPIDERKLRCETEYLLGGKNTEAENLEIVLQKILWLRFPVNYTYLLSSQVKQAEAEATAATLCSLIALPELTTVIKHGILLAWAYGESIVDVQVLADKGCVPTIKNDKNWQLQMSSLLNLGKKEVKDSAKENENGLDYKKYLYALLMLKDKEELSMRALDMMEMQLGISMDDCITQMQIKGVGRPYRGKKYELISEFYYE